MSIMTPVPSDHPLMKAWTAYQQTSEYVNSQSWARHPDHTEGSLWAAFERGWRAAKEAAEPESAHKPAREGKEKEEPASELLLGHEFQPGVGHDACGYIFPIGLSCNRRLSAHQKEPGR